ncbi:hypothetical protein BJ742DRAFT_462402 [Cladochytrium replicatum]|nr:hypothetical protein BJ742DRAFT_462402 [Cladochytrium replicatum]
MPTMLMLRYYSAPRPPQSLVFAVLAFLAIFASTSTAQSTLESACSATYAGIANKDFASLSLASDPPASLAAGALPCACASLCTSKPANGCDFAVYRSTTNPPSCQVFRLDKSTDALSTLTVFKSSQDRIVGALSGGVVVSQAQQNSLATCLQRCTSTNNCDFVQFSATGVSGGIGSANGDTTGSCVLRSMSAATTNGVTIVYRLVPLGGLATATATTATTSTSRTTTRPRATTTSSSNTVAKEGTSVPLNPAATDPVAADQKGGGLSTASVVAVVVASLVGGLGLAAGAMIFILRGKGSNQVSKPSEGTDMGGGGAGYDYNSKYDQGYGGADYKGYVPPLVAVPSPQRGYMNIDGNEYGSASRSTGSRGTTVSGGGGGDSMGRGGGGGGARPPSQTTLYTSISEQNRQLMMSGEAAPPMPALAGSMGRADAMAQGPIMYQVGLGDPRRSPSNGRRGSSASNGMAQFSGSRIDTESKAPLNAAGVEYLMPASASTVMSQQSASSYPTLQTRGGGGANAAGQPESWSANNVAMHALNGGGGGAANNTGSPKHMTIESLYSTAVASMLPVAQPGARDGKSMTVTTTALLGDSGPLMTAHSSDSMMGKNLSLDQPPKRTASIHLTPSPEGGGVDGEDDEDDIEATDLLETRKTYMARYGFDATREDELVVVPGDGVYLDKVFKDGWGVGVNSRSGAQGFFPVMVFGVGMGVEVITVGQ